MCAAVNEMGDACFGDVSEVVGRREEGEDNPYVCVSPFGATNHDTPENAAMKSRPMMMLQLCCLRRLLA